MTGILSMLIFSGLRVIVAVDHPYAGPVKLNPEALLTVLEEFGVKATVITRKWKRC